MKFLACLVAALICASTVRAQTVYYNYNIVDQVVYSDLNTTSTAPLELRVFAPATQTGIISGDGLVTKSQSGKLIVTGNNTYTGGTDLEDGILELGSAGALGSTGAIGFLGGTLRFTAANTTDYSSRLYGFGYKLDTNGQNVAFASNFTGTVLYKMGTGTLLLTGDAVFTSAEISGGSVQLGNGGTTGALATSGGQISIANLANLTINRSDNLVLDAAGFGTMVGAGSFTKAGSGTLTLNQANFHTGGTTLADGVLELGADGALGSTGPIYFYGGTLRFLQDSVLNDLSGRFVNIVGQNFKFDTNGHDVTFMNPVQSGGFGTSLTKTGTGTLSLAADVGYGGLTTVSAGTLQLGLGNAAAGSLVGPFSVASGATLSFYRLGSFNLPTIGTSSNAGTLTLNIDATATLMTAITGAGNLTVTSGTLKIADGGSVANTIDLVSPHNSALIFDQSGPLVHSGVISGAGSLTKQGAGTLTLAADNTYTGQTTISAGTLRIGNGGATGAVAGDIINFGTLAFNRTGTLTHAGYIGGPGDLVKLGSGTVILTGNNLYSGGTTLTAGVLEVGSAGAINTSGTISLGGGTLRYSSANATDYSARFSTANNQQYRIDTNGRDVTFGTALTSSGGSLTKSGDGTLTLTANATFTGGTTVSGGTLQFGNGGPAGYIPGNIAISSGATLAIDRSGSILFPNLVSGSGTLLKLGSGGLTLTADSSVGATVSAGTLTLGNGGTTGSLGGSISLASGATLNFNRSDDVLYSGALSGTGTITKAGAGTLTLEGSSTNTGNLTVYQGTLQIGRVYEFTNDSTRGSFAGNVDLAAGTGLVIQRHENYTHAGAITGDGSLTVKGYTGLGVVTLTGDNSYTGGTTIDGRTLVLGSAGALGSTGAINLINNGGLRHTAANTTDYSGRFASEAYQYFTIDTNGQAVTYASGFGAEGAGLIKAGAGTLTLTGNNSFGSYVGVDGGTLALSSVAALGGAQFTNVAAGATLDVTAGGLILGEGQILGGSGTVAGVLTLGSGASLNPGSSPGTLTFTDGLTLNAGSMLNFELGSISDLIVVSGGMLSGPESGLVTLNIYDSGGFAENTYVLFDFTGASTGGLDLTDFQFGDTPAGFDLSLAFNGSHLELTALAAVPEPSTYAVLFGIAALGLVIARRQLARRSPGEAAA